MLPQMSHEVPYKLAFACVSRLISCPPQFASVLENAHSSSSTTCYLSPQLFCLSYMERATNCRHLALTDLAHDPLSKIKPHPPTVFEQSMYNSIINHIYH